MPETLVVAGEYDSRVDPLHAKKFVAAVQNNPGQVSPFLLYMDFDSGHGTGKTTQQRVVDRDYELRFVMNALGMNGRADDGGEIECQSAGTANAVLPPRLVDGDGDRVRQVEAAHIRAHRNAQRERRARIAR